MDYKDFNGSYSFVHDLERPCGKADLAVGKSLEYSRSLKRMEQINESPTRRGSELAKCRSLLMKYYDVAKSKEGADAYSPLMLLKCLLLEECLRPGEYGSEWVSYSL